MNTTQLIAETTAMTTVPPRPGPLAESRACSAGVGEVLNVNERVRVGDAPVEIPCDGVKVPDGLSDAFCDSDGVCDDVREIVFVGEPVGEVDGVGSATTADRMRLFVMSIMSARVPSYPRARLPGYENFAIERSPSAYPRSRLPANVVTKPDEFTHRITKLSASP